MLRLRTLAALGAALIITSACSDGGGIVAPDGARFDGGLYGSGGRITTGTTSTGLGEATDSETAGTTSAPAPTCDERGGLYGSGGFTSEPCP
jgi:hypothetical protein